VEQQQLREETETLHMRADNDAEALAILHEMVVYQQHTTHAKPRFAAGKAAT
jgi:hypothetical protein